MKKTLNEASNLLANAVKIREITLNDLKHSETDALTIRPFEVFESIMEKLKAYENSIGRIGIPTIYGSHITITSINGAQVTVGKNGRSPQAILADARDEEREDIEQKVLTYEDTVDLSVRYGRILFQVPIGDERKYQITLSCLYSLEKKRLEVTLGARLIESNSLNITSDRYLIKGDTTNLYEEVLPKISDMLDNFSQHAIHIVGAIEDLNDRFLTLTDIKAIIARQHYVQACIKNKDYSGLEEPIDDRVSKDMHYKMFHTDYSYRIRQERDGGSVWQCYQCINEALRDTDLSLLEFHGKYLEAFNFYAFRLDNFLNSTPVTEFENGTNKYTEIFVAHDVTPNDTSLTFENPAVMLDATINTNEPRIIVASMNRSGDLEVVAMTNDQNEAIDAVKAEMHVSTDEVQETEEQADLLEKAEVPEGYFQVLQKKDWDKNDYMYVGGENPWVHIFAIVGGMKKPATSFVIRPIPVETETEMEQIQAMENEADPITSEEQADDYLERAAQREEQAYEDAATLAMMNHELEQEPVDDVLAMEAEAMKEEPVMFIPPVESWQDGIEIPEGYQRVSVGERLYGADIYTTFDGTDWLAIPADRVGTTVNEGDDFIVLRANPSVGSVTAPEAPTSFILEAPDGYRKLEKGDKITAEDYFWHVPVGEDESNGQWANATDDLIDTLYVGDGVYIRSLDVAAPVAANEPDDMPW